MTTNRIRTHLAAERGAVIIHVTIALVGLLAFGAFVIDYGVMWAARRQAQNAADAGALAGAISLAYVDFNDQGLARQSALDVAVRNNVWGEVPNITPGDVTFPICPPGAPGAGTPSCVRVDLFRNQARGNALPTFFGKVVGVEDQGVRATATAEALFGDSTDCVKPFAIADRWTDRRNTVAPPNWSEEDTFERYDNRGDLLPGLVDSYGPGDGYTPASVGPGGGDYGRYITLKSGNPNQAIAPGWYHPVVLSCVGANCYSNAIATCNTRVIGPGTVLDVEPGNMIGPTSHGMADLIALDPEAEWNPNLNGSGRGGIEGGCMALTSGGCTLSPRVVAVPVYDPDAYDLGRASGRVEITITKVIGFFVDRMQGNEVKGYIMNYPSKPMAGMGGVPGNHFVISVALVR
jgi:Flp pilus assembly protein TadG